MLTFDCAPTQLAFTIDGCDTPTPTFTAKLRSKTTITSLTVTTASSPSPPVVTVSGFPSTLTPGRYQIYLASPDACCCFFVPFILNCAVPYIPGTHHPTNADPFPVCCTPPPPGP